ncbi:MAG: DUF222 domain-containing protein [Ilumatobacteraceae bacterium]
MTATIASFAVDLSAFSVDELRQRLATNKRLRAALDAENLEIVALLDAAAHHPTTPAFAIAEYELMEHAGLSKRDAIATVARANVVAEAPVLRDALARGSVTSSHVDAVSRGLRLVGDERDKFLEKVPGLIESASHMSIGDFSTLVTKTAKGLVSDDGMATFDNQRRSTFLKMWNDAEGMLQVRGAFDPLSAAVLQARLAREVEAQFHNGDKDRPVVVHPWIEPNDHRRALALVALLDRNLLDTESSAGSRSDVVVHVDLDTLVNGLREGSTHRTVFGADLPVNTIRRLACDAEIIPVVLNGDGVPLDVGRAKRLATAGQRRALEAAHDTCAMPECVVAFHHCQIHHIDYWESGGPTDFGNLVPLCSRHHHDVHEGGWTIALDPSTRVLAVHPPGKPDERRTRRT